MAATAMPAKAVRPMPSKSVVDERPKAVANVRLMVVEVAELMEVIKMIKVIENGGVIDVGRTFITETVVALVWVSEIGRVRVMVGWGGVRSLCATRGNYERRTQYERCDKSFVTDHDRLCGPMPVQR
jgi:hypothetical protein